MASTLALYRPVLPQLPTPSLSPPPPQLPADSARPRRTSFRMPTLSTRLSFGRSSADKENKGLSDVFRKRRESAGTRQKEAVVHEREEAPPPPAARRRLLSVPSPLPRFTTRIHRPKGADASAASRLYGQGVFAKSSPDLEVQVPFQLDQALDVRPTPPFTSPPLPHPQGQLTSPLRYYAHKASKSLSSLVPKHFSHPPPPSPPPSSTPFLAGSYDPFGSPPISLNSSVPFVEEETVEMDVRTAALATSPVRKHHFTPRDSKFATQTPPSFNLDSSPCASGRSSPFDEAIRDAAREEAFSKLTASSASSKSASTSPAQVTFPSKSTTPSRPTRPLPPLPNSPPLVPFEVPSPSPLLFPTTSPQRSQSLVVGRHSPPSPSSPPARPPKAARRRNSPLHQSFSGSTDGVSEVQLQGMVRKTWDLLEREFGSEIRRTMEELGMENLGDERELWEVLRDGVFLCRLLNRAAPGTRPIPTSSIDKRGFPSSMIANISTFHAALSTLYSVPAADSFLPADLTTFSRAGIRQVLRTIAVIDGVAPSPSPSPASTQPLRVSTQSDSWIINNKGRALRARNAGSSIGFGSEASESGPAAPDSPSSIDSHSPNRSRRSLDSPGQRLTFVDQLKDKGTSRTQVYGGDRRMAESAVEFLSAVDEGSPPRSIQPILLSRSNPGSPIRPKRFTSDTPSPLFLDRSNSTPGPPPTRRRHSSEVPRTTSPSTAMKLRGGTLDTVPPSPTGSSLRSISPDPTPPLDRPSSSYVPFPSTESSPPIQPSPLLNSSDNHDVGNSRPRHKRWNSELFVERPLSSELVVRRARHQSYAPEDSRDFASSREGSAEIKSSRVTRTKLVLRAAGKQTVTYQLGECIGRGQFGSVYRALNLNSGRVVAVKRIQLEGKTEEEVSQLSNEISLLKSLVHPSVVRYEGVVRTEHFINIILEYVENGSLQKTLKHFGELPEPLVASYVVKILEGLAFLHAKKVVHCDLKSANILSTKNGNIKLSDFGVSLSLVAVQKQREVAEVTGTPNWMAPEVIQLQGASTASDIWSLGCVVIELISGRPPYADLNAMSVMFRIVEDDRPPLPDRCSPELRSFLSACFAKDPLERPTAVELFEHDWLTNNWDCQKDIRPQDSIPFLSRFSPETRRPVFDVHGIATPERQTPDVAFSAYSCSPSSARECFFDELKRRSTDAGRRVSTDTRRSESSDVKHSQNIHPVSSTEGSGSRAHDFVKTSFSKAIECKICHSNVKRGAVLCSDCGLLCHLGCREFAPLPCDLRTQLLNYGREGQRTPSATRSIPSSPSLVPHIPSTPSSFNLAVILPFAKLRRHQSVSPPPRSSFPVSRSSQTVSDQADRPEYSPFDSPAGTVSTRRSPSSRESAEVVGAMHPPSITPPSTRSTRSHLETEMEEPVKPSGGRLERSLSRGIKLRSRSSSVPHSHKDRECAIQ